MDVVGPRANGEIMALARQASADELSLGGTPASELRKAQADQLAGEALRLCGTSPSGETPSTCNVSYGDTDLPRGAASESELIARLRADTVAAAARVPESSVDLVVAQAVDTVALEPVRLAPPSLDRAPEADVEATREALRGEYALEYGLGLATAWADDSLRQRIDALRKAADERREALVSALAPTGEVPAPAPGYETSAAPSDAASAAAFVEQLRAAQVARLRRLAAEAQGEAWRDAAIGLAAHAQRA
ncbi:hypothetical protein C3E79_06820 [Corynebacterium liangguodongii]|uniref:DUF4439 domain-containing protein n=2 Tax=Corynebacterium liangguodongii TaxID=2079535 RepID=A0A2S0WH39_9CORY|nr:hypothetical protein C3E79_06820 [Corynebacterium liangguodongii]PWC00329.1 DUF4439 domain-containing protein [Corynebacterium liangguodongii]